MPKLAALFAQELQHSPDTFETAMKIKAEKDRVAAHPSQKYEKGTMVGKDGKAYDYLIDKTTGEAVDIKPSEGFGKQQFRHGYAAKVDPNSGVVLPSAVTEDIGLKQLGIGNSPLTPQSAPQPQAPQGKPVGLGYTEQDPLAKRQAVQAQLDKQAVGAPPPTQPQAPTSQPRTPSGARSLVKKYTPVENKAIDQSYENLNKTPGYKEASMQIQAHANAMALIDQASTEKNPIAKAQLGNRIAKVMGEVGSLSESDVTRGITRPDIKGKVLAAWNNAIHGTLRDEDAKYLKMALNAVAMTQTETIKNLARGEAERLNLQYGISTEESYRMLLPPSHHKFLVQPKQIKSLNDLSPTKGKKEKPITEWTDEELAAGHSN